jgi:hypothetical protein
MIHKLTVEKYSYALQELTTDLGNLSYDALANFLLLLSEKIESDAAKDKIKGRHKLATSLHACAEKLQDLSAEIEPGKFVNLTQNNLTMNLSRF